MKPKRSLGQNFLRNKNLANSIVRYVLNSQPKRILEVGPGTGVFTNLFIKQGISVVAIEKDDELSKILSSLNPPQLKLINRDILEISREETIKLMEKDSGSVCFGALPYNISKKIISHLVPFGIFSESFFIIQKEVAEKYLLTKKGNRLSSFINAFVETKVIMSIAPANFFPVPKVTSALIQFKRLREPMILGEDLLRYNSFVKALYNNQRKMLHKNPIFKNTTLPNSVENLRPEELSLEAVIELFINTKQSL